MVDTQTPLLTEDPNKPLLKKDEELLDASQDFNFDDFQVVRREFFSHLREPSITFNNYKFTVNSACLARFPSAEHVQILINRQKKILALRPCNELDRDSFQWCTLSKGRRKARLITCKLFFAKIVDLMGWEPEHKYKLLGKLVHANGEYLLAFDLTSTEIYRRAESEDAKSRTSRVPQYPLEWQNQFGMPVNEHRKSLQVNIFDNYAVFAVRDTSPKVNNTGSESEVPPDEQSTGTQDPADAGL